MDITKLTTKRLLAYYKSHRKKMYSKYRSEVIGYDSNNKPITEWSGNSDCYSDYFHKDLKLFNDLKNELQLRENIKKP